MKNVAHGVRSHIPRTLPPEAHPALPEVIALVADKLERVEDECSRNLRSEYGVIDELGRYLTEGGGKRVRPILLLLSSQMCGYKGELDVLFASVFEFIHTATLVHDDVVDQAELRRGKGSLNARWGNGQTVLLGDYLYIKSMNMALWANDIRIIKILASVTLKMIEGELIAHHRQADIDLTEREHLEIIRSKTAYLFSGCSRVAGVLSEAGPERTEALAEYGMHLGMAFQIIDDMLDFTSEERVLGKPVASDLKEGTLTLPLIYLLEQDNPAHRELVQTVLDERGFRTVTRDDLLAIVRKGRTLERTRELAVSYATKAQESLWVFDPCPARTALQALPQFVISRSY